MPEAQEPAQQPATARWDPRDMSEIARGRAGALFDETMKWEAYARTLLRERDSARGKAEELLKELAGLKGTDRVDGSENKSESGQEESQ